MVAKTVVAVGFVDLVVVVVEHFHRILAEEAVSAAAGDAKAFFGVVVVAADGIAAVAADETAAVAVDETAAEAVDETVAVVAGGTAVENAVKETVVEALLVEP